MKYLNTVENEKKLLDMGCKLPSLADSKRFEEYKYIYNSLGWIRGIKENQTGAIASMELGEIE